MGTFWYCVFDGQILGLPISGGLAGKASEGAQLYQQNQYLHFFNFNFSSPGPDWACRQWVCGLTTLPTTLSTLIQTKLIERNRNRFISHEAPNIRKLKKQSRYENLILNDRIKIIVTMQQCGTKISIKIKKRRLAHKVFKVIRSSLNLDDSTFLSLFDKTGKQYRTFDILYEDMELSCWSENSFGGSDESTEEDETSLIRQHCNELRSRHRGVLSLTFANVSGGLRFSTEKKQSIIASTFQDSVLLLNECNCVETDAAYLAETFGVNARVVDLSQVTYDNGARNKLSEGNRKLSGFGTACISKRQGLLEYIDIDNSLFTEKFEILATYIRFRRTKGLIITAYRSPSMTDTTEINAFYMTLYKVHTKYYTPDVVFSLICMDDNKMNKVARSLQEKWLIQKCGMINMIGDQVTRMISSTQPDSILGIFKPLTCTIRATVISPLGRKMDHNAIRIKITGCSVEPRKPTYRTVTRKVRIMSDEQIGNKLCELSTSYVEKYSDIAIIDDKLVESAAVDMFDMIRNTKMFGWKTQTVRLPDCLDDRADPWVVKIGMEHARMEKLGLHLQKHPDDRQTYNKFIEAQSRCLQFMAEKRDADCDRDMKYNKGSCIHGGRNMGNFYRWCDRFVSNKKSYLSRNHDVLTKKEKEQKLAEHDDTFISKDPNFTCDMEKMLSQQPDRHFSLDSWKPGDKNSKLADFIRSRSKIDKFFKVNADIIATPLFNLLKLIERTGFFPVKMRTSKATFIPGRTIFSLETLTKIVEGVLGEEFTVCVEQDYRLNGDPGGFAYRKFRGVLSCLGLTLSSLQKAVEEEMIDAIMNVFDLKKAFNSTKRSTVVKEAQRVAGAGRIMMTRWLGRTYTFEGQTRGHEYNRGIDAGAVLSVWGFDQWINTDISTQHRGPKDHQGRPVICEPCNFSDDRSTNTRGSNVENGLYQTCTLDGMESWAHREGAEFHVTGIKGPGTLIISRLINGVRTRRPMGIEALEICGHVIPIITTQKILGLVVSTKPFTFSEGNRKSLFRSACSEKAFVKQAQKLIDKHGFFLQPDMNYLVNSAYRFHQLRDEISPLRMWLIVNSYLLGKMKFGIAYHYLMCTDKQIETMRYYYGMSMAAILNISAYEALGAACCANQTVKANNSAFERLRIAANLPSIEEMAIADAKVCIDQMVRAKKEWFLPTNKRQMSSEILKMETCWSKNKKYYPKYISDEMKDTLVYQVWTLGLKTGAEYRSPECAADVVSFRRNWEMAIEAAEESMRSNNTSKRGVMRTARYMYQTKSLVDMNAFEQNDRRLRRRTPSKPLIPSKICKVYPPDVDGKEYLYIEEAKPFEFSCDSPIPSLWLRKEIRIDDVICLICGDKLSKNELKKGPIECTECHRSAHRRCIRKLKLDPSQFKCESVKQRIVPIEIGSMKLRKFDNIKPKVATGAMRCLICGELHTETNRVKCARLDCEFSCHSECLQSYNKIILTHDGTELDIEKWCCDDIQYWVDRRTATKILELTSLSKEMIECFIDNHNIDPVKLHPDVRKRRYDNDENDQICQYCNNVIALEQRDHVWSHCPAIPGSPPSKDPMESMPRIKRRCLEIVKAKGRSQNREALTNQNQSHTIPADIQNPHDDSVILTRTYASVASTRVTTNTRSNSTVNTHTIAEMTTNDGQRRDASEDSSRSHGSLIESRQSDTEQWSPTKSPARKRARAPPSSIQVECRNRFAALDLLETPVNDILLSAQQSNQEPKHRKRHRGTESQKSHAEKSRANTSSQPESMRQPNSTEPAQHSESTPAGSRHCQRLRPRRSPRRDNVQLSANEKDCVAFRTRSRKAKAGYTEVSELPTEGNDSNQSNNIETLMNSRGQNYRMSTPGVDFSSRSSEVCSGTPRPPRHRGSLRDRQ